MVLLQEFAKINKIWPNASIVLPYDPLNRSDLFEIAYFTASDVSFRCFSIKLNPSTEHLMNVALLYNTTTTQFISLLNKETEHVITIFDNSPEQLEILKQKLSQDFNQFKIQIREKSADQRDQITKCILVLRKVDETVNLALSKELNRRVYFAIGECRERAALIPIFQNSSGADLVQLALNKWMNSTFQLPQEEPFPQDMTTGLVKNFLQIKKWLRDLVIKQLAGISTVKTESTV